MSVAAIIPVKSFLNAKQRLAPILTRTERALLAEMMFRDTLSQTLRARGLEAIYVVTADDLVSHIAASQGARIALEAGEKGETEAVRFALETVKKEGIQTALVIPADIPLLRARDLESLLREETTPPSALLVPSHDQKGTNLLMLSPPDVMELRFGSDSFCYHLKEAARRGLNPKILLNERIALDIDEPRDLKRFLFLPSDGETRRRALAMNIPGFVFSAHTQSK
jgi:2-phospho-L-lactate guanylyltransferase